MKLIASLVGVSGAALMLAMAGSASAATITVTDVEAVTQNTTVNVPGFGNPWTTPIVMKATNGKTYVTFCDDLQEDVFIGGGQNLVYTIGRVDKDGTGKAISESTSNRMGQLAKIGQLDYAAGDIDGGVAAQAAIWAIEYNFPITPGSLNSIFSTDGQIQADFIADLAIMDNGKGWANGMVNLQGHTQSQLLGGNVPEPATWAMMMLGLFGLGGVLRQRRSAALKTHAA